VERWWDRQAGGKGGKAWVAEDADGEGIMETADGEVDYRHRHGFRQDRSDLGEFLPNFLTRHTLGALQLSFLSCRVCLRMCFRRGLARFPPYGLMHLDDVFR
jgi:hypothetical protein